MKKTEQSEPSIFIGIGAQKAGTTWLSQVLKAHPQVALAPLKELHFFDRGMATGQWADVDFKFLKQLRVKLRQFERHPTDENFADVESLHKRLQLAQGSCGYQEYFNDLASEKTLVAGEITPAYATLSVEGFRTMRACVQDAKLVFILREPASRIWSHNRFLEMTSKDKNFRAADRVIKSLEHPAVILRTDYQRTIEAVEEVFPADRLLVLFYENLFNPVTHKSEMRRLTTFLGIADAQGDLSVRHNESRSQAMPQGLKESVRERFAATYRYIASRYEKNLPPEWQ